MTLDTIINCHYTECRYVSVTFSYCFAECHNAECRGAPGKPFQPILMECSSLLGPFISYEEH